MMAVGTMKRKLKWIAVVLVVLLVGMATALFLWPRDRITPESWEKIRIGMTEKEVEEILGQPGRKLDVEFLKELAFDNRIPLSEKGDFLEEGQVSLCPKIWLGRCGTLDIDFD